MKKLLIGAGALLASLTGVIATASPAEAAWGGHGFYHGGYGYHGSYGYRGGWGYRGGGWGWSLGGLAAGLAVGAALSGPAYYAPPPAYYVGPNYYAYYGGCRREWVWTGWGYRAVRACY